MLLQKSNLTALAGDISRSAANLEENDKIKAELKPVKISEPKTPYHGPLDMDGLPDEGPLRRGHAVATSWPVLAWGVASLTSVRFLRRGDRHGAPYARGGTLSQWSLAVQACMFLLGFLQSGLCVCQCSCIGYTVLCT